MKRYSDLMKNGVITCDKEECGHCYNGVCCFFASSCGEDRENTVCLGKMPKKKAEALKIGFFRADFSSLDTDTLKQYKDMFDNLQYFVDVDSPNIVDVWKVLSRMRNLVSNELYERDTKAYLKSKARKKKGIPLPKVKKRVIKPVKAKR